MMQNIIWMLHHVQKLAKLHLPIHGLLIIIHLIQLHLTFFDSNNKITYKNVLILSKLKQALDKF